MAKEIKNYTVSIEQSYNPDIDYYEVLGVAENATTKEIMEASMKKIRSMKEYNKSNENMLKREFEIVTEAYKTLSDDTFRKPYDEARKAYIDSLRKKSSTRASKSGVATKPEKVQSVESSKEADKASDKGKRFVGTLTTVLATAAVMLALALMLRSCGKEEEAKELVPIETVTPSPIEEEEVEEVVEEAPVYEYTDPRNEEELQRRANKIYQQYVASNIMNISPEKVADQLKFMGGAYSVSYDNEAYDMLNSILETIGEYSVAANPSVNFAGEAIDNNLVHTALDLSLYVRDDSAHNSVVKLCAQRYKNVLSAQTKEDMESASYDFLEFLSDLMVGNIVDENGTKVSYINLEDDETFIIGVMSHLASPVIKSSLGEEYELQVIGNNETYPIVGINEVLEYYNPQEENCEVDTNNTWYRSTINLVTRNSLNNTMTKGGE